MTDNPIDRFYAAMSAGDSAAIQACMTPDGRVWHGFDQLAQSPQEARAAWEQLFATTAERGIDDVRRTPIAGGYLQTHAFVVRTPTGDRIAWPVCIVVRIEGDLIARLDEYIDRAGRFAAPEGAVRTPGL